VIAKKFELEQPDEKTERKDKQKRGYRSRAFWKDLRLTKVGMSCVKAVSADLFKAGKITSAMGTLRHVKKAIQL
jgi:hypothetical protein